MISYHLTVSIPYRYKTQPDKLKVLGQTLTADLMQKLKDRGMGEHVIHLYLAPAVTSRGCQKFTRLDGKRYELSLCAAVYEIMNTLLSQHDLLVK